MTTRPTSRTPSTRARALAAGALAIVLVAGRPIPAGATDAQREIDLLFGMLGTPVPTASGAAAPSLRELVRDRMKRDAFYASVLPRLFLMISRPISAPVPWTLSVAQGPQGPFYYLDKPCAPEALETVAPWWDAAHPIKVCKDAHRPELKSDRSLGTVRYCEKTFGVASDPNPMVCACGPNLVNCARDKAQEGQLIAALYEEPIATMRRVVQAHLPFSDALKGTATVRSGLGDFFYARSRFFADGKLDNFSPAVPLESRARDPQYTGGVLSAPQYLFYDDSQRGLIARVWEDFLCQPFVSASVHAKDMFHLNDARLRETGQMGLASQPGCRDCHARMEHALLAYRGFTTARRGMRFLQEEAFSGVTKFFVRDATDQRGEGPATLAWIGDMISRQPEFDRCMTDKIEELVWKGLPVPRDVHEHLLGQFTKQRDFARLVEDAVVARFGGKAQMYAAEAAR